MSLQIKIGAIVVTYNRKKLLVECLKGVFEQSVIVNNLYVIDNASTDYTFEYICKVFSLGNLVIKGYEKNEIIFKLGEHLIFYKKLEKNTGGAGGFYEGIKMAVNENDYLWLMDDDTIPEPNALESLLLAARDKVDGAFFASNVINIENNMTNIPNIDLRSYKKQGPQWNRYLSEGYVEISTATFVSLLFPRKTILEIGLPIKEFFIWFDDTEYTKRAIQNEKKAYLVGKSVVLHKKNNTTTFSLLNENDMHRMSLYRCFYRNSQYVIRKYGLKREYLIYFIKVFILICKIVILVKDFKILRIKYLLWGVFEGIFFNPQIERVEIKNEI